MKPSMFRSLVKWFAILIVVHLITFFVFDTVLSGLILPMVEDGMRMSGHTLLLLYELALHLIIALTFVKSETSFTDYQKALKDAIKSPDFSVLRFYQEHHLTNMLWRLGVFVIYQIPFIISFAAQGFVLERMTFLECLYVMDVGTYAITDSFLLGFLFAVAMFAGLHAGAYIISIILFRRDEMNF